MKEEKREEVVGRWSSIVYFEGEKVEVVRELVGEGEKMSLER